MSMSNRHSKASTAADLKHHRQILDAEDGYQATDEFMRFCLDVAEVVKQHPEGLWLAGIKRGLGDKNNDRWLYSALSQLESIGAIRKSDQIPPSYFDATPAPNPTAGKWNGLPKVEGAVVPFRMGSRIRMEEE